MKKAAKKNLRPRKTQKPSAAKGKAGKSAVKHVAHAQAGDLRIRMYRVGFGDFFLMTVPSAKGPLHIVIDCGVTGGTSGKGDIGTIKEAVADMAAETGGKLALIIMTHRHMDHIIGFSRCPEFKKFKDNVEAIWMPVWENEHDLTVSRFQNEMFTLAADLHSSLALAADTVQDGPTILAMLQNATGRPGKGGGSNAASLELLKHGLGVKPAYYCKGSPAKLPQSLLDAGLSAQILGPPPLDASDFMSLMDLRKGVGQYLDVTEGGYASGTRNGKSERVLPFSKAWRVKATSYPPSAFWEWEPRKLEGPEMAGLADWKHLQQAVNAAQPAALMSAAKKNRQPSE